MRNVTDEFVKFALEYADYDKIPAEVIHESKRVLLDGLGNALGGIASDKGKIGIMFARRQGSNGAASLIGVGGKSSAAVAAFCNAELWNGLDMDPVPHVPPIVIPAILAVAEERGSTGKELLAALCVGQEVARRLSRVLLSIMTKSIMKYGKTPDFFGNSNEHIIGAAVGCGMLMKLNEKQMRNAIGIAAYYCSLGVCRDWESTSPKSMIKYVPVSWMAQGAVQAAEMAELGYTGNEYTLDSEYGWLPAYLLPGAGCMGPRKGSGGTGLPLVLYRVPLQALPRVPLSPQRAGCLCDPAGKIPLLPGADRGDRLPYRGLCGESRSVFRG